MEKDQTAKKPKGDELEKDNAEEQKLEEQHEAKKIKRNLEIVTDDEDDVFVNVTPLSSKPATIMDYKIYKEGNKEHFQIIRANGNHQMYLTFSTMLKNFDREDLEVLWKIIKDRPKDIIPNVQVSQMDDHTDDVTNEIPEPRKGKRVRKSKSYGFDFQIYLVEGSRNQVGSQYSYFYSIEEDPRIYNEALQSRDAAF
nr:zinc finger, CCHC-type [Tanacetum cinerariifolium]